MSLGAPTITAGVPAITLGVPAITAGVSPSRTLSQEIDTKIWRDSGPRGRVNYCMS